MSFSFDGPLYGDFRIVSVVKLTTSKFPEPIGAGFLDFSEQYLFILNYSTLMQHSNSKKSESEVKYWSGEW